MRGAPHNGFSARSQPALAAILLSAKAKARFSASRSPQGPDFQKALAKILPQLETEIVKRSNRTKGFVVLPRRWVVECTFACQGLGEPQSQRAGVPAACLNPPHAPKTL